MRGGMLKDSAPSVGQFASHDTRLRPLQALDPPGILERDHEPILVKAQLSAPGILVELCECPVVRGEKTITCETDHILCLGLSPLLPQSSGRFRSELAGRFASFGALHLRPAGVPLEFRYASGGFRSVRCRFDPAFFSIPASIDHWTAAGLEACLDIREPRIENALLRLADECSRPKSDSDALVAGLGATVQVDLARYLRAAHERGIARRGGLSALHLRRITEFVESSVGPPSNAELADVCGLSRSHLMRAFRLSTGSSVGKYVEGVRITKAKAMLAESTMPIAEIAKALAFPSATSFSHVFRRATGRTPRDYRTRVG